MQDVDLHLAKLAVVGVVRHYSLTRGQIPTHVLLVVTIFFENLIFHLRYAGSWPLCFIDLLFVFFKLLKRSLKRIFKFLVLITIVHLGFGLLPRVRCYYLLRLCLLTNVGLQVVRKHLGFFKLPLDRVIDFIIDVL